VVCSNGGRDRSCSPAGPTLNGEGPSIQAACVPSVSREGTEKGRQHHSLWGKSTFRAPAPLGHTCWGHLSPLPPAARRRALCTETGMRHRHCRMLTLFACCPRCGVWVVAGGSPALQRRARHAVQHSDLGVTEGVAQGQPGATATRPTPHGRNMCETHSWAARGHALEAAVLCCQRARGGGTRSDHGQCAGLARPTLKTRPQTGIVYCR
jgi:hypothetical protein